MPKHDESERLDTTPFPIERVGVLLISGGNGNDDEVRQLAMDYLRLRHLIMWGDTHLRPPHNTVEDKLTHQNFKKEARRCK